MGDELRSQRLFRVHMHNDGAYRREQNELRQRGEEWSCDNIRHESLKAPLRSIKLLTPHPRCVKCIVLESLRIPERREVKA